MRDLPAGFEFTVEDYTLLRPKLLWCYEGEVGPWDRLKLSDEPQLYAWWLKKGSVTLRRGRQVLRAEAGQWLLGSPQPRLQHFSEDARILSVNFKLEWPSGDSLFEEPLVVGEEEQPQLGKCANGLLRCVQKHFPGVLTRLWERGTEIVPFFELNARFSAWLVAYLQAYLASGILPARMAGVDPRVLAVLRELDRPSWNNPMEEKALAARVGLTHGHMIRLFVRDMKMTPGAYLQARRTEAARDALLDSDANVKEIAYDLGFSSPGHFCYWFRKQTGSTPLEFRRAQRQRRVL